MWFLVSRMLERGSLLVLAEAPRATTCSRRRPAIYAAHTTRPSLGCGIGRHPPLGQSGGGGSSRCAKRFCAHTRHLLLPSAEPKGTSREPRGEPDSHPLEFGRHWDWRLHTPEKPERKKLAGADKTQGACAAMGASSAGCRGHCVSWHLHGALQEGTSLRLLTVDCAQRTTWRANVIPTKAGVVINSQPKFKGSPFEVSGARQGREMLGQHLHTHICTHTCTQAAGVSPAHPDPLPQAWPYGR